MRKVLFVATVVKTHIMEFHIPYLKLFHDNGWLTAVAAKNDYENPDECAIPYCDRYYNIPFERSPLRIDNVKAFKYLKALIDEENYDIIHCHTPMGGTITRLASTLARKKGSKIIYTAHGFHFFKGAPLLNWILYYPVERLLARKTDVLITINKEDYNRARKFSAQKVVYVPGVGVDLERFAGSNFNRAGKRSEFGLEERDFVLLSVGELIKRKNHISVLYALNLLKKQGRLGNIHYLICGRGVLLDQLREKAIELEIGERVHFAGYRTDINDICASSDLFVFMSLQEGLPVALMEAMATGIPVICSSIRGNTDLIQNGINGEIVNNKPNDIAEAIYSLSQDDIKRGKYAQQAKISMRQYDIKNISLKMWDIYMSCL